MFYPVEKSKTAWYPFLKPPNASQLQKILFSGVQYLQAPGERRVKKLYFLNRLINLQPPLNQVCEIQTPHFFTQCVYP